MVNIIGYLFDHYNPPENVTHIQSESRYTFHLTRLKTKFENKIGIELIDR